MVDRIDLGEEINLHAMECEDSSGWVKSLEAVDDQILSNIYDEEDCEVEDDINSQCNSLKRKKLLKKAPDAPKRFKSAYIYFVMDKMDSVRSSASDTLKVSILESLRSKFEMIIELLGQVTEMMKILAQMWNNLPNEQKLRYEDSANADKER